MAISTYQVLNILAQTKGATPAHVETATEVVLSAGNKKAGVVINKITKGAVMLFNNLKDADPYLNKVIKTSVDTDIKKEDWVKREPTFRHTACYSLAQNIKNPAQFYLVLHWVKPESIFMLNGIEIDRDMVASYQTPSEAKKTLNTTGLIHNVTNDTTHEDFFRTVKLENVTLLTANKQTI